MYFNSRYQTSYLNQQKGLYHKRRRTEWADHDSYMDTQILELEKDILRQKLQSEKLSNQRAMKIVDELISDRKKQSNGKNTDAKRRVQTNPNLSYSYSHSIIPQYQAHSTQQTHSTQQNQQTEKSSTKPDLKKSQNNPEATSSISIKSFKELTPKKQVEQKSNSTKAQILNRLYEESSKKQLQNRMSPAALKQAIAKNRETMLKEQIVSEEIVYLKQQLQEKNRLIVDLQCELIRKNKINSFPQQKQQKLKKMGFTSNCIDFTVSPVPAKVEKKENFTQTINSVERCISLEFSTQTSESNPKVMIEVATVTEQVTIAKQKQQKEADGKRESNKNAYTQTSENLYDYIEETYLEWIFEKDYEQMQARKKNSANPPKNSQSI